MEEWKGKKRISKVWSLPPMSLLGSKKFQELMLNIYVSDQDIACAHTSITLSREQGKGEGDACSLEKLDFRIIWTD